MNALSLKSNEEWMKVRNCVLRPNWHNFTFFSWTIFSSSQNEMIPCEFTFEHKLLSLSFSLSAKKRAHILSKCINLWASFVTTYLEFNAFYLSDTFNLCAKINAHWKWSEWTIGNWQAECMNRNDAQHMHKRLSAP